MNDCCDVDQELIITWRGKVVFARIWHGCVIFWVKLARRGVNWLGKWPTRPRVVLTIESTAMELVMPNQLICMRKNAGA